jgi:hypothetical protein
VKEALEKSRHDLKDPDSAKFRNRFEYTNSRGFTVVCGEINAKNSYGAYAGFQRFAATKLGATIAAANVPTAHILMDTSCVSSVNDTKVDLNARDYWRLRSNYSLKRTTEGRLRCYHAHTAAAALPKR